jgi:hypothetical protein
MEERRRAERTALDGQLAILPSNLEVRVLDISVAGILLQASQPLDIGARGRLRLNLWGAPFTADVEVRRVSPPRAERGRHNEYRIGAVFIAIASEHRQLVERFMSQ